MIVSAGNEDIRKVSPWLGHSSPTTTEVYVRADPTEKLEAIWKPSCRRAFARQVSAPDKLLAPLKGKP